FAGIDELTAAFEVNKGEMGLGLSVALLGSLPIPLEGFLLVLGNALALIVKHRKMKLRDRLALLRSLAIPARGFRIVWVGRSVVMHVADFDLRRSESLVGGGAI